MKKQKSNSGWKSKSAKAKLHPDESKKRSVYMDWGSDRAMMAE